MATPSIRATLMARKHRSRGFIARSSVRLIVGAIAGAIIGVVVLVGCKAIDLYGRIRRWPIRERLRGGEFDSLDSLKEKFMRRGGSESEWHDVVAKELDL